MERKNKLLNHIFKKGKKNISEKILTQNFKSVQKSYKKSHHEIIKLAILNSTPTFRVIKLRNKRRKKKTIKEIPAFFSTYPYRTSWALKYLIKSSNLNTDASFATRLKHEILSTAEYKSNAVTFKKDLQIKALQKKKYFRYYRW